MLTDNAVVCLIFFLLALLFSQPFQLRVPIQFPHLHRVLAPVRHYFHEQAEKNLRSQQAFQFFSRLRPDALQHISLMPDEDFLLRIALHVHGHFNPQELRRLLKLVHDHGQRVRHLVVGQLNGFFPDDLAREEALRLVRNLILRKKRLPFRQILENFLQQLFATIAPQRGNGHQRRERKRFRERIHQRQKLGFRYAVNLVQRQYGLPLKPLGLLQQQSILLRQRPYGIHHQQQYINPFQRRRYLAHHLPVQRRIGLVHTRRINEHHLPLRVRHDPLNAVARGLRLGRDDGHLLPHEPVQQRGLPCVRPAHDGHESRVPFLFFSCCHCFFVHDSSFFPCLATHPSTISWALAKPPPANAARAAATLFAGSPPPLQTETLPDQPCPPARELFRKHGSATPQSSSPSRRMHRRSGRRATPPRVKSSCCRAAPGCHPLPSQHPARAASRRRRFRPQSPPLDLRPSQCPPRSHARQSPPPAPGPFAASHGAGPSPALFPEQTALGA